MARTPAPRSAHDQLAAEFADLQEYLIKLARRARPRDTREAHLEMVAHAWVELCRRLQRRSAMPPKELLREARNCLRIGRRNFLAGEAHLTITGYQQFVALLRIRYAGGVAPLDELDLADLCRTYNTDGTADDIARRREQGRMMNEEQAARLLLKHRQVEVDFVARADDRAFQPEAASLRLDIISALQSMQGASKGATALADHLRQCLLDDYANSFIAKLQDMAEEVGLRGGTRDRAVADVRRHLKRELGLE